MRARKRKRACIAIGVVGMRMALRNAVMLIAIA